MQVKYLKEDLVSGFVISLIALPLSIGIALASGVPVSAGVLAAIIAGIVGSLVSGVGIGISGPGAGMIVVVATATQTLGNGDILLGFKRTIACVLVVGVLQIITGILKLGRFTKLCPEPVVKGMLSAIGAIIIVKQLPVWLGVDLKDHSMGYFFTHFFEIISGFNGPVLLVGAVSIAILIAWKKLPENISRVIPGTLVAVIFGSILASFFSLSHGEGGFFVNIPGNFKDLFIFPVFDQLLTVQSISTILSIYVISSLESFLCAYAVEEMDPLKRKSNLNKDIMGKGLANMCCGLLGGFPVILAIVRTTANIQSGGKTIKANFFHGCFILFFVAFFSSLINQVPLTVLASILILVGYSLINPKNCLAIWQTGKINFLLFILTLSVTVMINLLIGIIVGIIAKFIIDFLMKNRTLKRA